MCCTWWASSAALLLLVSAASAQPDLSGLWIVSENRELPSDLSYQPEFQKLYQQRKVDGLKDDPAQYCLPNGVTRVTDRPYKIVQTPKLVVLLSEGNTHSYRRFFLDGRPHNTDFGDSWTGDSVARWEGDTLVVDTIGFNDRSWLDDTGKPHSDALHVVERYRRPAPNRLEVQYLIEDAKALTASYSFTRAFTRVNRELEEYFCTEKNIAAQGGR